MKFYKGAEVRINVLDQWIQDEDPLLKVGDKGVILDASDQESIEVSFDENRSWYFEASELSLVNAQFVNVDRAKLPDPDKLESIATLLFCLAPKENRELADSCKEWAEYLRKI